MSDHRDQPSKLMPNMLLGKTLNDVVSTCLIFGYKVRVIKQNGQLIPKKLIEEGRDVYQWDVGIFNDRVTEIWAPNSEKKKAV